MEEVIEITKVCVNRRCEKDSTFINKCNLEKRRKEIANKYGVEPQNIKFEYEEV